LQVGRESQAGYGSALDTGHEAGDVFVKECGRGDEADAHEAEIHFEDSVLKGRVRNKLRCPQGEMVDTYE
jgi:hypothetical protein